MMLYVCFDDSDVDPTYMAADGAFLVDSDDDVFDNPCVATGAKRTPLIPMTRAEANAFAEMLGWTVTVNGDGNVVFVTSIK